MSLHTIRTLDGQEYVLLPVTVYRALKKEIDHELSDTAPVDDGYIPFEVANYVDKPHRAGADQRTTDTRGTRTPLRVSQDYVSKIESQDRVSPKTLAKVKEALAKRKRR